MASVWRATDTVSGRTVAVKRLHARLHDDAELAERFRREGEAVARLSHPNLVQLLDQGQDGDEPFLVFELVEGRDLKSMIRSDGRLPVADATAICAQVARALAAAHEAGIVHRDIKSHNVLVTPEGVAKLTDFGIARIIESEGANLTKTGIVMGSSDYLAPEQAEGREVGARGDVYSLGVVLFEALTGRLPFAGDNPVAVATKHVYEAPPNPRSISKTIPNRVAAACLRALAKRPADRFASAAEFADALEGRGGDPAKLGVVEAPTGRIRQVKPRRKRAPALIALGILVAVGAGFGLWQAGVFDRSSDPRDPLRDATLPIAAFDHDPPPGDQRENSELVPLVIDGNPESVWTTEGYKTELLGGGKPGVGLRITLTTPSQISGVRIQSATPGGAVQILGEPTQPEGRSEIGRGVLPAGSAVIPVNAPGPLSELIIWLTELPRSGDGEFPFRASIGEVAVLGVAKT